MQGKSAEDLPAPYNLQAVVLNNTVALTWTWDPPDPGPAFLSFGFEVMRDNAFLTIVPKTAYSDLNVPIGKHTYMVRVKGEAKEGGRTYGHYSAWSEPAEAAITLKCAGPPVITLKVEPTKRMYGSTPALRLHLIGDVKVPEGCHAERVVFHVDSGMSSPRTGPLLTNSKGHFDEFTDALGGEEEPITGSATFQITVTAEDEAGGATSNVYTIDLQQENPYAPKQR